MVSAHNTSGMEGLRVVRGPDWRWGNQDGGEGFVGTVVDEKLPKVDSKSDGLMRLFMEFQECFSEFAKTKLWVTVVWDCGTAGIYRAGHEGAFDLRVLDNAALGVIHSVSCGECLTGDIKGFRWLCKNCTTSLCSSCYYTGKHDTSHTHFERIDSLQTEPAVVDISTSKSSIELKGIFPGAMVKRGFHWENGDEDVKESDNGIGTVKPPLNMAPGWIRVEWEKGDCFEYRLGAQGKVDVRLEKHVACGSYFPPHLPVLKPKHIEEAPNDEDSVKFAAGDIVEAIDSAAKIKRLQKGHGEWVEDMQKIASKKGIVVSIHEKSVRVRFPQVRAFFVNPAALKRIAPYSIGEPVRIKNDLSTTLAMIEAEIPDEMINKVAGETGRIFQCLNEGEVLVTVDGIERKNATHKLSTCWIEPLPVSASIRNKMAKLKADLAEAFIDAAAEGELYLLNHILLERGVCVDDRGAKKGRTALHMASQRGQLEVVKWLVLKQGADVDLKDEKGRSAIHHAAKWAQSSVLSFLIKNGAKLNEKDDKSWTPIQLATRARSTKCITILASNTNCDINSQDSDGDTALYNAIIFEAKKNVYFNHEIVDYLLTKSDLKITNKKTLNSLSLAASVKNRRVIEILLKEQGGALANFQSASDGYTALHISCSITDFEGVKLIVQQLGAVISAGSVASFLEIRCRNGFTPLLVAAFKGSYSIVEYLVNNKANVESKTNVGDTAVHLIAGILETLKDLPTKRDSPEIFKIHQELVIKHPTVLASYPALSLLCFLIKKGCPWRNPISRQANIVINDEKVRQALSEYCPGVKESVNRKVIECILCPNTEAIAAVVEGCNHDCGNICSACISQVTRCPVCKSPNSAYGRLVQPTSIIERPYSKPSHKGYAARPHPTAGAPHVMDQNPMQLAHPTHNALNYPMGSSALPASIGSGHPQYYAAPGYGMPNSLRPVNRQQEIYMHQTQHTSGSSGSFFYDNAATVDSQQLNRTNGFHQDTNQAVNHEQPYSSAFFSLEWDNNDIMDKVPTENGFGVQSVASDRNPLLDRTSPGADQLTLHEILDNIEFPSRVNERLYSSTLTEDSTTMPRTSATDSASAGHTSSHNIELPEIDASMSISNGNSKKEQGRAIPMSEVIKNETGSRKGKPLLIHNGIRYSFQRTRGANIRVYQCAKTRPEELHPPTEDGKPRNTTKNKCPATIEEFYRSKTNKTVGYLMGPHNHQHATSKRLHRN